MNDTSQQTVKRKQKIVRKLLKQYAEIGDYGRTRRCTPTEEEIARGDFQSGNNGKAIFASEQAAQRFVVDVRTGVGGKPQRVYPCPRGDHWHTTSLSIKEEESSCSTR